MVGAERDAGRNIRFILDKIGHDKDIFKVKTNWLKKDYKSVKFKKVRNGELVWLTKLLM